MREDSLELLTAIQAGDETARSRLVELVYDQLRGLADRMLAERPRATLQATELIHEAWLRLADGGGDDNQGGDYESLRHYRRVAARAMRFVLVDRARAKLTDKRGGKRRAVTLDDEIAAPGSDPEATLAVHEGLERLADADADLARLVELRFFGGMTVAEAAENLAISERSAHRQWRLARAWWLEEFGTVD